MNSSRVQLMHYRREIATWESVPKVFAELTLREPAEGVVNGQVLRLRRESLEYGIGGDVHDAAYGRADLRVEGANQKTQRKFHGEGADHRGGEDAAVDKRLHLAGNADADER